MNTRAIPFVDLHEVEENERIRLIGEQAMAGGRIGIMLEGKKLSPGKIERYIKKITERYPMVYLVSRKKGPVKGVELLLFTRKAN